MGVALAVLVTNFIAKIVKIIYIGGKVDATPSDVMRIIVSSWRYAIILLPVSIMSYMLLPQTLGGDIAMAGIYTVTAGVVFVFMPKFVGKQYCDEVYSKVRSFIESKLHRK